MLANTCVTRLILTSHLELPSMVNVNVRRDVDDKFYRYKMPLLETKVEGRGNGIKTVIPNMVDIGRALSRPPSYPTKFFGYELGAQTQFDEKNERYIINGKHEADRLREVLDVFIDKFVLCGECKNPETDLAVKGKEGIIRRNCKACGAVTTVDMRHKLTNFIITHPPPKRKKGVRGAGQEAGQHVGGDEDEDGAPAAGSDDEMTKQIASDAKALPAVNGETASKGWTTDMSEAAVKARTEALAGGMATSLVLGDDEEGDDADSPYGQYGTWLREHRGAPAPEVYKQAQEFGIVSKHKTLQVLMENLFTANAVKELEQYEPVIAKMCTSEKHQKSLLGGLERLAGVEQPSLVPLGVPKLLMMLYQLDVLDDEFVKNWGSHVSKKYVDKDVSKKVRRSAAPFLQWLEEADDDSSDGDSDDE